MSPRRLTPVGPLRRLVEANQKLTRAARDLAFATRQPSTPANERRLLRARRALETAALQFDHAESRFNALVHGGDE